MRWVEPDEVDAMNPAMAPGQTLGASYSPGDGYIDPPRNVLAYTAAIVAAGVRVWSGRRSPGCDRRRPRARRRTSAGDIATSRVVLTGGPTLAAVGRAAGSGSPPAARGTRSW